MSKLLHLGLLLLTGFTLTARANNDEPTLILIMIDGARPALVRELIDRGELPYVKKYFRDGGADFRQAYTMMPLTTPSWSVLLSGRDVHHTGIKGNDIFDRQSKKFTNFLDWREEIIANRDHGQAYRYLWQAGVPVIMDFFNRGNRLDQDGMVRDDYGNQSDVFMTFFPINDRYPLYQAGTLLDNLTPIENMRRTSAASGMVRFLFDENSGMSQIDADSLQQFKKVITQKSGSKKKLLGMYFSDVDHSYHANQELGLAALKRVDYQIGEIFKELSRSRYSNSVVALVSDHGQMGGKDMALTMTNLSQMMGGFMPGPYRDYYQFNVESVFVSEGQYSLRSYPKVLLYHSQCTNLSRVDREELINITCAQLADYKPEKIHAAVATNQTISLPYASQDSNDWETPNNWYTLTRYQMTSFEDGVRVRRNLVADLENFRLNHLNSRGLSRADQAKLEAKVGLKPLDWLAIAVRREDLKRSDVVRDLGDLAADAILIHRSSDEEALILSRPGKGESETYRYIPIRGFSQERDGRVDFELSQSGSDPFNYRASGIIPSGYVSAREWIKRFAGTKYPQAVPAVSRLFRFEGGARSKAKFRFDIFLNPADGHLFTADQTVLEAGHGMLQKQSSQFLFMLQGPGIQRGLESDSPVLSVDFLPTVLSAVRRLSDQPQGYLGEKAPALDNLDGRVMDEVFEP
jgi:hypothetical protein